MSLPVVGRLAPSPTGALHVGNARTFLIAWLAARASGGRVILRVEDIDDSRVRPEATAGAVADLHWLDLDWDEGPDVGGPRGPYLQSERMDLYRDALGRLIASDLIYPCTCTRADIARAASAPHENDEGPTYPGTCAGRSAPDAGKLGSDKPFAWRFRVPSGGVTWDDLVLGPVTIEPSRVGGDFVVAKSSGAPSYQLAVALDDGLMGVTQVVRGDDLVPSTPRQILIHRALGFMPPVYAHVPLVHGPDGRRLAKRDQSVKLATLRAAGVFSEALVGWLARSIGMTDAAGTSPPADWVGRFGFTSLPRRPAVVSAEDLESLGP